MIVHNVSGRIFSYSLFFWWKCILLTGNIWSLSEKIILLVYLCNQGSKSWICGYLCHKLSDYLVYLVESTFHPIAILLRGIGVLPALLVICDCFSREPLCLRTYTIYTRHRATRS